MCDLVHVYLQLNLNSTPAELLHQTFDLEAAASSEMTARCRLLCMCCVCAERHKQCILKQAIGNKAPVHTTQLLAGASQILELSIKTQNWSQFRWLDDKQKSETKVFQYPSSG